MLIQHYDGDQRAAYLQYEACRENETQRKIRYHCYSVVDCVHAPQQTDEVNGWTQGWVWRHFAEASRPDPVGYTARERLLAVEAWVEHWIMVLISGVVSRKELAE